MEITLTKDNIKDFMITVLKYEEPILLDNHINAKSLYSVMTSIPCTFDLRIVTNNNEVLNKFNKDIEKILERNHYDKKCNS